MQATFVNFAGVLRISPEAHQLLHKSEVLPGMVLLSMSGSVGSVAVALDSWNYPINSNQDIAKIIPSSVNPFYLAAFLSSSFGRTQINRLPVGSVQQHIFLWMIERIQVPRFSFSFEAAVARITQTAYESHEMVSQYFAEADDTLLEALGLEDWTPPEPLSYTARASDTFTASRLDAQYFMPAKKQVRQSLAAMPGDRLGERMNSIRNMFVPDCAPATMKLRNYNVTDALVSLLDAREGTIFRLRDRQHKEDLQRRRRGYLAFASLPQGNRRGEHVRRYPIDRIVGVHRVTPEEGPVRYLTGNTDGIPPVRPGADRFEMVSEGIAAPAFQRRRPAVHPRARRRGRSVRADHHNR